jgi:chromosome segregation ATPase
MAKSAMTPGALAYRATAAPFRVAIGLALAASAGVMLWGVGTHCVSASEFAPDAARETPMMTIEDRVAALMAELAEVKAENAKLRESQSDTSEELSRIRASLANAEIGLAALRTTTDENEAHRRETAAQIASNLARVNTENAKLRESQSGTSEELSGIRASLANAEIGLAALRTTIDENEAHRRDMAAQIASNLAQLKEDTLHLHMVQNDEIGSLRARVANIEIGVESLRSARPQAKSASKSGASRLVGTRPARSPRDTSISARRSGWRSTEPHVVTLDIYR